MGKYDKFKEKLILPVKWVCLFWIIEIIDFVMPIRLDHYGIIPRNIGQSWGILTSPFLHGNFTHVLANSVPFIVFGTIITMEKVSLFYRVFFLGTVLSGIGVWLVGKSGTVHIGASGVVFAFLGFLLARGIFAKKFRDLFIAMAVFLLYGPMIFGVLPVNAQISWEGHLFGLLGGGYIAYKDK